MRQLWRSWRGRSLTRPHLRDTLLVVVLLAVSPGALAAQQNDGRAPAWAGDVGAFSINALIGGITAGIGHELRGGSFRDGFLPGAVGGGLSYGGRRLSAERFDGAGLIGRQISAVGVSVVSNASAGRGNLDRLMFPVGPVHLYVDRTSERRFGAKLDVFTAATVARALATEGLDFDLGRSVSSGAMVFIAPGRQAIVSGDTVFGVASAGVILIGESNSLPREAIFAHERVHVLQYDFSFGAWSNPVEEWLLARLPGGDELHRYFDFAFTLPAALHGFYWVAGIEWKDRPNEIEAEFLENR